MKLYRVSAAVGLYEVVEAVVHAASPERALELAYDELDDELEGVCPDQVDVEELPFESGSEGVAWSQRR